MFNQPSVEELIQSVEEGFETLQKHEVDTTLLHTRLQVLDAMLWDTIVELGLG